jgi:hypothetical protein
VAEGKAGYASGDVLYQIAFTATLAGTPDATPPGVLLDGTATVDPVALPLFRVTEPAAETSKARLVTSGAPPLAVDLVSRVANGVYMPVVGFERPTVVLRYGATYHIDASGVADFAGLSGAATDLTFDTPPAPPLAAEDGFEAAAGTSLGGAAVVRDGPLPPIAGTTSLYIGSVGAPWSMRYQPGRALTLRLPVLAGDKKLRFSYRTVASYDTGFEVPPTAVVGVVDGTMTTGTTFSDGGHRTKIGPVENGTAYLGDVQTAEMAVPPGAPTEVVFELAMPVTCRPLRPAGLLIDDVRVE